MSGRTGRPSEREAVKCSVYYLRVELSAAQCVRLRRMVKEMMRDPSEVVGLALDLFWVASKNGKAVDCGNRNGKQRRRAVGESSEPVAIAKCLAGCDGAVHSVQGG